MATQTENIVEGKQISVTADGSTVNAVASEVGNAPITTTRLLLVADSDNTGIIFYSFDPAILDAGQEASATMQAKYCFLRPGESRLRTGLAFQKIYIKAPLDAAPAVARVEFR